jgi:hypothetical protein
MNIREQMSDAFSKGKGPSDTKEKEKDLLDALSKGGKDQGGVFAQMMGEEEAPDTRTKREKLLVQEQNVLKFLSPQEQEEYLGLVEEYEEKYPNIFAEIDDSEGPKDEKFTRIKDLREKANKAWQNTTEYKSVVEGQK